MDRVGKALSGKHGFEVQTIMEEGAHVFSLCFTLLLFFLFYSPTFRKNLERKRVKKTI